MKFSWRHLVRFDLVLSSKFESLGSWIARSPGTFILFPILITLLMGSGLQQFNYASNVFYLFVPVTAQSIEDAHTIATLFPPNASRHVQGSELGRLELMEIILIPKEGFSALSEEVWQEAQSIVDIVGEFQGKSMYFAFQRFKPVCFSLSRGTFLLLQGSLSEVRRSVRRKLVSEFIFSSQERALNLQPQVPSYDGS